MGKPYKLCGFIRKVSNSLIKKWRKIATTGQIIFTKKVHRKPVTGNKYFDDPGSPKKDPRPQDNKIK
jgi:hypothetical protein